MAEKGRGASEKEEKNAIREEMMKKAIAEFQSLGFQERKNSIFKLQREALVNIIATNQHYPPLFC